MSFIKMLFLMLFIYLTYKLLKLVMQMKKNIAAYQKRMESQRREAMNRTDRTRKDENVIELDKNQYKVE
ncbi:MAG: hypothetical protein CVV44_16720 [Spirochaetae bacterium HGW-Spirochaetae-1]|jgi:predicted Holliday junction resolvase-like endonuclease|nr:MAG: hypothetical protein CVV44_16720 [Spirochaetae bacterium HGW-Spirochaetae-1]